MLSEVKGTSMVLYVHGKCPESRALILCLVYTRQSKGISCASSNSNVIRSGGSRRRDYSINTNTIFGGHTLKRKTTLTTQSRVGEYDCGWNHAAADYLRCSKGACTHLDASDLISLLDVLLTWGRVCSRNARASGKAHVEIHKAGSQTSAYPAQQDDNFKTSSY